ncbi:MAG: hypothetical protein OHK0031_04220 [Anaerolineales bacterium]
MTMRQLKAILLLIWSSFFALAALFLVFFFWKGGDFLPVGNLNTPSAATAPSASATPVPPTSSPPQPAPAAASESAPVRLPSPSAPSLPENLPPEIDPLTGLRVDDLTRLERNPVSVKITNFPRHVRAYQFGLNRADVVYEYYIEDGLSRFIAVFYGQDAEKAGPVRSGRYFDEHIARMYQAYLVFANADDRVEAHWLNLPDFLPFLFLPREDNCPPLCRDKKIQDYNNFFVNTRGVTDYQAKTGHKTERVPLRPTYFNAAEALPPLEIDTIHVRYSAYSYHVWHYDPLSARYWRESDAQDSPTVSGEVYSPHMDKLDNQQVSAVNLVVLIVPHNFNNDYDRADQLFNISLLNSGAAYIFRGGRAQFAYWRRDQINQPIQLTDENGRLLALSPGNTFFIVLNPESSLQQWEHSLRFTFSIPPRTPPQ